MQAALSFGFLFGLFFAIQPLAPKFTMRKLHLLQGVIWLFIILFAPPLLMSIGAAPGKELLSAFALLWAMSLPFYVIGVVIPIGIFWMWRKIRDRTPDTKTNKDR